MTDLAFRLGARHIVHYQFQRLFLHQAPRCSPERWAYHRAIFINAHLPGSWRTCKGVRFCTGQLVRAWTGHANKNQLVSLPFPPRSECPAAGLMNRFSGLWKNSALVKHRKKFRLHAGYEQNTPDQESVQSIPLMGSKHSFEGMKDPLLKKGRQVNEKLKNPPE